MARPKKPKHIDFTDVGDTVLPNPEEGELVEETVEASVVEKTPGKRKLNLWTAFAYDYVKRKDGIYRIKIGYNIDLPGESEILEQLRITDHFLIASEDAKIVFLNKLLKKS